MQDPNAKMVMMSLTVGPGGSMDLETAAARLHVPIEAMDDSFGVIEVDPKQGIHTVRVDRRALPQDHPGNELDGPFSDPKIGPMNI